MNIEATYPKNEANNTPLNSSVTTSNLYQSEKPLDAWKGVLDAYCEERDTNKWGIKL